MTRHGTIQLIEPACTSCMICARECPTWCISIDSHAEPVQDLPPGARPRTTHVLDRFAIDWSLCMYCGICVEVCPFDALFWTPEHDYPADEPKALVHEREQLREWVWTVPPPPPLERAPEPER